MKFTLKDYQEDAVRDVLVNLRKASKRWLEDGDKHAFSLTATTGAGKTVMAAAVFEALFHGDDNFDFEPDPGAVVIWFSDDPSLNEQSKFRLLEASDRVSPSDLVVVQNTFNRESFEPGKIYFLNTQKLSKNSLLVRGAEIDDEGYNKSGQMVMPDLRAFTIWDTIQNTINDPSLTLILVLDEAHRGMGTGSKQGEKTTIVKRLINGSGSVPGIPLVWGISATVERFNDAISGMQGRATLPNVVVDSAKVQASGLLKDTIILDVPNETGQFDTVLVRRGTDKLKEISSAWNSYHQEQGDVEEVYPLMVLQVPNSPDHDDIGIALDTIYERWPEMPDDAIAHVFGEHTTQTFGRYTVPYISPERVQESTWVRVLIAKDAISTGWDCPRAEVMVSFRPARDKTHITQLLGRMVRTPLARRIPGNERLNSVDCLLPFFDETSVKEVAQALMTGSDGGDPLEGRRILINPEEMVSNPSISEEVWKKFLSLPSQTLPKRQAKPIKRLTALAHELAFDEILPGAGALAHTELHKALNAARKRYEDQILEARQAVLTVEGRTLNTNLAAKEMSFDDFLEAADYAVVDDAYRRASRGISPDIANSYSEFLAKTESDEEDYEEALMDAHATVAALGLVTEIQEYLEVEAETLAKKWLIAHRIAIKSLSDERQDVYREIREMSTDPMDVELARPSSWMQATTLRDADGTEKKLPHYEKHLLCNSEGLFPGDFNTWEVDALNTELKRQGTIAWYRNPARASQDSLGITYEDAGAIKMMRPDFIFFSELADGSIAADIVDPHGTQFSDSIPKLRGLAKYAEIHGDNYRRIDAIAKIDEQYKVLDLKEESVRELIVSSTSVTELYKSSLATEYV